MTTAAPRVSIVIVTYNSRFLIDRCLAPLAGTHDDIDVIVWDNASSDGTAAYVAAKYPWVQVVAHDENLGFARANNAAISACRGQYSLLLNPDAFVTGVEQVRALARVLDEDPAVAAAGPKLLHADGMHQVGDAGWRVGALSVIGHFLFVHRAVAAVPAIYLSNERLLHERRVDVDWLCGACMMVRTDVFRAVGGFDASIFMYGEDMELGERLRRHGHRLVYAPEIEVVHLQGATQRAEASAFYSTKYLDRLLAVLSDQHGPTAVALLRLTIGAGFLLRAGAYAAKAVQARSRHHGSRAHAMWKYARYTLVPAASRP